MNREIKFRGLRTDGKGWVYGSLLQSEISTNGYCECTIVESFAMCNDISRHEVSPESVGQFTGLKDKNGVDIYEGDIVETDGSMSFSNYDSDKGSKREIFVTTSGYVGVRNQFDKVNNSSAHIWSNYQLWNINRSLQIIGNIHQNPELI